MKRAAATSLLALSLGAAGASIASQAHAGLPTPCPDKDSPTLPAVCYKEVRVINNTNRPIYAVVQGSIIKQAAIGCSSGDVWLQRALGVTDKCLPVTHDYYIYVNPTTGILPGKSASIELPWWSRPLNTGDLYIDWWRSARFYTFDDPKALADIYDKVKGTPQLQFAKGSPVPACKSGGGDTCALVQIWKVPEGGEFGTQTPAQLNEYTFASVDPPSADPAKNYELVNLNQNYNVSNVDQAYLPLAMEPIRPEADIGYMGTTISVEEFRKSLALFTGVDANGYNPTKWPVYNNPTIVKGGSKLYPVAGIRVPSAETVLNFYMNPYFLGGDLAKQKLPQILPYNPANPNPPTLVRQLLTRWTNCVGTGPCAKSGKVVWSTYYKALYNTFVSSYDQYLGYIGQGKCKTQPAFLDPMPGSNPQVPANKYALLRYIYGWVPFNVGCDAGILPSLDLPTVAKGSKLPISYVQQQYDYTISRTPPLPLTNFFNPYTPMVHNSTTDPNLPGLDSNAYAFSIDDVTAFQTNSGSGLIFAVGGDANLPNKTKVLPTVPPPFKQWDIGIYIGDQHTSNTHWAKYGICSSLATSEFPTVPTNVGFAIGVDPAISNFPCMVTLEDSAGETYQFTIAKSTKTPPQPIWPEYTLAQGYDQNVITCTTSSPKQWCQYVNEVAIPSGKTVGDRVGPIYTLSTRGPLPTP